MRTIWNNATLSQSFETDSLLHEFAARSAPIDIFALNWWRSELNTALLMKPNRFSMLCIFIQSDAISIVCVMLVSNKQFWTIEIYIPVLFQRNTTYKKSRQINLTFIYVFCLRLSTVPS